MKSVDAELLLFASYFPGELVGLHSITFYTGKQACIVWHIVRRNITGIPPAGSGTWYISLKGQYSTPAIACNDRRWVHLAGSLTRGRKDFSSTTPVNRAKNSNLTMRYLYSSSCNLLDFIEQDKQTLNSVPCFSQIFASQRGVPRAKMTAVGSHRTHIHGLAETCVWQRGLRFGSRRLHVFRLPNDSSVLTLAVDFVSVWSAWLKCLAGSSQISSTIVP